MKRSRNVLSGMMHLFKVQRAGILEVRREGDGFTAATGSSFNIKFIRSKTISNISLAAVRHWHQLPLEEQHQAAAVAVAELVDGYG